MVAVAIDVVVEREAELALIGGALSAVGEGSGRLLVVEGPAGIGKSSVLGLASAGARDRGFLVVAAVAGEFERELGFGVVRQLFESALRRMSAAQQRAALAGAAGLTRRLLLPSSGSATGDVPEPAALMHGLYWLAANLSERQPLAICVDDAHWCDQASLGWLLYLARRLDDVAIVLVVAVRSGEPQAQGGPLAALADLGQGVALAPLSEGASAQFVRDRLPDAVDDKLARACFELTGGNPFLLSELVRALAAEVQASGGALLDRVRALTPDTVSRSVIARLRRLPVEAAALARALAVLGGRAELHEVLSLAGVDHEAGLRAVEALEREQIVEGRPVRFVHPLVATAVYGELSPAARSLQHARAARVLAAAGADVSRVASHLLHAEPASDHWAVEILRCAAHRATADGTPETAVRWLARALAEPPPTRERAAVLHELGAAELRAGPGADGAESRAQAHLAAAATQATDPRARAAVTLDWGDALWATHHYQEAVRVFDDGIEAIRETDGELALRIEAHAAAAARLDLGTCGIVSWRLKRFGREPPASPAGRLISAVLAIDRALAGDSAHEVTALAERMLEGGGHLPTGHIAAQIPLFAINALLWSDRLDDSRRLLGEMINIARAAGSARGVIVALCWRGVAAHRSGALAEAASDLATAVDLAAAHTTGGIPVTHALLSEVLLDCGDLPGAVEALAPAAPPAELPDYVGWNYVLHARGAIRAAQLDFRGALEDFLACGARQDRWQAPNPSVIPWRSQAALAYLALENRADALALAIEELRFARRFGAPRAIGIALRALGLINADRRQVALLREAASVLESSPAKLEHARALADLGAALRRSNQRAAARGPLRDAITLATRCGALPIATRANNELIATGARPRKAILTGLDALTPIERQAAIMAADGMSNPQIAQALFISRKTVEKRLSETYRKLDIRSREQLGPALAAPTAPPTQPNQTTALPDAQ